MRILVVVVALLVGGALGYALRSVTQATVTAPENTGHASASNLSRSLTSNLKAEARYPSLDLAFFATVELAYRELASSDQLKTPAAREPRLCLALVGLVEGDEGVTPPNIPEFLLNWVRTHHPSAVALPECVERWGALHQIATKPAYEGAHLVIVRWPRWVFGSSFAEAAIIRVVPMDIHTYGSTYLLQVKGSDVTLADEESFRRY